MNSRRKAQAQAAEAEREGVGGATRDAVRRMAETAAEDARCATVRAAVSAASEARAEARTALVRIESHEDRCAERYAGIAASIAELKGTINRGMWALLAGMAGIILALLRGGFHL